MKSSFGILLSSIGILWNETLSGIGILKELSLYVINLFEYFSGLHIPRIDNDIKKDSGIILSIAGFIITGVTVTIIGIFVFDFFYPEAVSKVPYVNTFVETVHSFFANIYSYIYPDQVNPVNNTNIHPLGGSNKQK